jgi:hypothetical protein
MTMHIKKFLTAFLLWLPLGFAITMLVAFTYLSFQQSGRQMANDPQIQMAEDAARALENGSDAISIVPNKTLELRESIAPFIMVFDAQGDFVLGDATLGGQTPTFPAGLLDERTWIDPKTYHQQVGDETRITWQPEAAVREALVIVHAKSGQFVAVGRSLRDTEDRVWIFSVNTFIAWFVMMVGSLFLALVTAWIDFHLKRGNIV